MSADTGSSTDAPPPPPPPPDPPRDGTERRERAAPESLGRDGLDRSTLEPSPEFAAFLADKRAELDARPDPPAWKTYQPSDSGPGTRGGPAVDHPEESPDQGRDGPSHPEAARGDSDRLLDQDPRPRGAATPDPTADTPSADPAAQPEDGEAAPVDKKAAEEPPSHDKVAKAFPDLYHYDQRPPVTEVEPHRPPGQWVADKNPGYHEGVPGTDVNCGDAARSGEHTWRGDDTRAVPMNLDVSAGEHLHVMDHWSTGDRVPTTFDKVQQQLEELGPGSSAVVGVDYAEADAGGHWFNAFNDNGRIVASDCQNGRSEDWPPTEGGIDLEEADCKAVDAVFIDPDGRHLTKADLEKGGIH